MDLGINKEFTVELTPKDEKTLYSQNLTIVAFSLFDVSFTLNSLFIPMSINCLHVIEHHDTQLECRQMHVSHFR